MTSHNSMYARMTVRTDTGRSAGERILQNGTYGSDTLDTEHEDLLVQGVVKTQNRKQRPVHPGL